MRRVQAVTEPRGLVPGEHLCWAHTGWSEWRDVLVAFLDEGRRRGERLQYVGRDLREIDELTDDLSGLPGRDELLRAGVLELRSGPDLLGPAPPEPDVEAMERDAADAVAAGYTGLRVAAEVTSRMIGGPIGRRRLARLELLCEKAMSRSAVTGLCGFDRRYAARDAMAVTELVHPLRAGTGVEDYCWLTAERDRWWLRGELDARRAAELGLAVAELPRGPELHLDVSQLGFVDTAGVRALLGALAVRGGASGSADLLRLHRPSALLVELLEVIAGALFPAVRVRRDAGGETVTVDTTTGPGR